MILASGLGEIALAHPYLLLNLGTVLAAPPSLLQRDSMILASGWGRLLDYVIWSVPP